MRKVRWNSFLGVTCCFGILLGNGSWPLQAQPPTVLLTKPRCEVSVQKDIKVSVRDGTKLALDLYLPAQNGQVLPGKHPVLLARTPYDKNGTAAEARWFCARGYAVVINDVRGRYASEGLWRMLVDDPNDGFDIVGWIGQQPWCNGKLGTFGTSYVGGTQHALAIARPPHLACMIPVDSVSNPGIAGIRHRGAFELRFMNWIFTIGAPNARAALADPALKQALEQNGKLMPQHLLNLPIRPGTTPLKQVPEYERWLVEVMRHGDYDAYWKQPGYSVVDNLDRYADVPVYHVTGWYDSWCRQNALNWMALSGGKNSVQKLIIGPWTHGSQGRHFAGEVEFPPEAALPFNDWRLKWFDHWLNNAENGVEKDPPVMLFIMGGGDGRKSKDGRLRHGGRWRAERTFPLVRTQYTPYYLHADGSLSKDRPAAAASATTYRFDPANPVPTIGGNLSSVGGILEAGGFDQRSRKETLFAKDQLPLSERRDVLVFQTEPLEHDVEVTGRLAVNLFVSSTAPDTDFTAKLLDVYPRSSDYPLGFDLNIGDSITRMRYRYSLEKAELIEPGKVYPITIQLYPTANVFAKGHRIRLDISSSNFPRFDVNPNSGEPLQQHRRMLAADNTVYHSAGQASHIDLPIIPVDGAPAAKE
ncbi:MAG TPA: CocE/NonD family hydrolase [Gemmataceae bacterium]|nr:CocE/NonD family hydrolase [Gemmataceae bacterium]